MNCQTRRRGARAQRIKQAPAPDREKSADRSVTAQPLHHLARATRETELQCGVPAPPAALRPRGGLKSIRERACPVLATFQYFQSTNGTTAFHWPPSISDRAPSPIKVLL